MYKYRTFNVILFGYIAKLMSFECCLCQNKNVQYIYFNERIRTKLAIYLISYLRP